MADWQRVKPLDEVPQGLSQALVANQFVMLVREGDHVQATSGTCPHKFTMLAEGTLQDGYVTCPMHSATFDLKTGRPGAGQEWAGTLPVFHARVREGFVEVML